MIFGKIREQIGLSSTLLNLHYRKLVFQNRGSNHSLIKISKEHWSFKEQRSSTKSATQHWLSINFAYRTLKKLWSPIKFSKEHWSPITFSKEHWSPTKFFKEHWSPIQFSKERRSPIKFSKEHRWIKFFKEY